MDDTNWDSNFASALNPKFNGLYNLIDNYGKGRKEKLNVDKWMESCINRIIKEATEFMEKTMFRSAIQKIFFEGNSLLRKYLSKTNNNPNKEIFEDGLHPNPEGHKRIFELVKDFLVEKEIIDSIQ